MSPGSSEPYIQRPKRSFASGRSRWTSQRWSLPPTISVPPHAPVPPRSSSYLSPHSSSYSTAQRGGGGGGGGGRHHRPVPLPPSSSSVSRSRRARSNEDEDQDDGEESDGEGGGYYEDEVSRLVGCWAGDVLARGGDRCSSSDEVAVSVLEVGDGECYTREFSDGDTLSAYLANLAEDGQINDMDRTIFIPYGRDVPFDPHGWSLAIDADSLNLLWHVFELPGLLAGMVLEQHRWSHGAWHDYFRRNGGELDIFYRYRHSINAHNSFIFTRTDLRTRATLTLCINPDADAQRLVIAALQGSPSPSNAGYDFGAHAVLLHAALDEADAEVEETRATLEDYEHAASFEHLVLADVHALTRQTNVLCAHIAELAGHSARVANLIPLSGGGDDHREGEYHHRHHQHDEALLRAVRERCEGSLRWLESYAHRAHNLLTIVGTTTAVVAGQRRRGSGVTIGGRRWSGSVAGGGAPGGGGGGGGGGGVGGDGGEVHWREGTGAEGMVVVVFLPATFVCALFSMAFFEMKLTDGGAEERFVVSRRVWAFFLVLVLVMAAVAAACWAGRRWRRRELMLMKTEFGV